MKKLLSLFAAVALLFAATACSDGSSDDDAPGSSADAGGNTTPASDSSIIVGTWEGDLYVADLPSFIVPKLTFTYKPLGCQSYHKKCGGWQPFSF